MIEHHGLLAIAAADVRVHGTTLDGSGADECHFHHEVIERAGSQARQGVELGAGFHLEHADGIGAGEHVIDLLFHGV